MKFKVGDRVCILDANSAPILTGSFGMIERVSFSTQYRVRCEQDDGLWYFNEFHLELVTELPKPALVAEGLKFDQDKAPISLIPVVAILAMARVFAKGAKKYGKHNFRLGMDHSRPLDAAIRHILAIINGEDIDPETEEPHWAHALCSIAMYAYMKVMGVGTDDFYKPETKEK